MSARRREGGGRREGRTTEASVQRGESRPRRRLWNRRLAPHGPPTSANHGRRVPAGPAVQVRTAVQRFYLFTRALLSRLIASAGGPGPSLEEVRFGGEVRRRGRAPRASASLRRRCSLPPTAEQLGCERSTRDSDSAIANWSRICICKSLPLLLQLPSCSPLRPSGGMVAPLPP